MPSTIKVYDREFPSFSRNEIHPRISQLLKDMPRGSLLDMPAGSGALSYRLSKEGFDVTACDIEPGHFLNKEIPILKGDLAHRFPFDDGRFDFACFVEGPEHSENPFHSFREFARVLKVGGRLVVTQPNYNNIERRFRQFFLGAPAKAVTQERFQCQFNSNSAMLHISPLVWTQLRFFLEASGFEIERIATDKFKRKQMLAFPLVALIQLVTRIAGARGREYSFADQANSNAILMGGNTLIVVAVKHR